MGANTKGAVVALISASNDGLDITSSDVNLTDLVALDGLKTGLKVSAVRGGRYRGKVDITYHRLGLATLFAGFIPKIGLYTLEVDRNDIILSRIAERFGVKLDVEDVTITATPTEDGIDFLVESLSEGLQFQESTTFKATVAKSPIDVFVLPDSDRFVYPQVFTDRTFARIYSGGWNVNDLDFELVKYQVGMFADDVLTWITRIVSGNAWVNYDDLAVAYNLSGAAVVYNGPISGANLTPPGPDSLMIIPEDLSNVMVVELDDRLCKNMVGKLTYYY